jgi:hypothetical protein
MSLKVTVTVIICAYGDVFWGINLGINLGFIPGYLLERYPLHPTKPLHRPNVRGFAGIPDSLAHKPVDTSGRAARSGSVIILVGSHDALLYIPLFPSSSFCQVIHYLGVAGPAGGAHGPRGEPGFKGPAGLGGQPDPGVRVVTFQRGDQVADGLDTVHNGVPSVWGGAGDQDSPGMDMAHAGRAIR